jgi:hypothetical protein
MRLHCSILLVTLLTAVAVFLGNLSHSEYQSQMRKLKNGKIVQTETPLVNKVEEALEETVVDMGKS